nr:MAG TPA: hypothetical protein [Caudoviricetes sp.]
MKIIKLLFKLLPRTYLCSFIIGNSKFEVKIPLHQFLLLIDYRSILLREFCKN